MNILTSLREGPRRFLARPFRYFGAEWERMAPRERRWVHMVLSRQLGFTTESEGTGTFKALKVTRV